MKAHYFHDEHPGDWRLFRKMLVISLAFHGVALLFFSFYKVAESRRVFLSPVNMIELSDGTSPPSSRSSSARRKPSPAAEKPPPPPERTAPRESPKAAEKLPPIIPRKIEDSPPVRKVAERPKPQEKEFSEEELREKLRRLKEKPPARKGEEVRESETELRERLNRLKERVPDRESGLGRNADRGSEAQLREKLDRIRQSTPDRETNIAAARKSEGDVKSSIEKIRSRFAAEDGGNGKAGVVASSGVGVGGASTGSAVTDVRFAAYREKLWEHVKKSWNLPPYLAGKGLSTIIAANVTRSGQVTKYWIEASSGDDAFDQSALRALLRAAPLPEIPPDIPDRAFADGLGFRFSERERQ